MTYLNSLENAPVLLIPAYEPDMGLIEMVRTLIDTEHFDYGLIVNDGSSCVFDNIFMKLSQIPGVTVLIHPNNLGKGAALKTGLNYIGSRTHLGAGVVTADADGQHAVSDILRIADALKSNPEKLVLGARQFDRNVPLRNRTGNIITSKTLQCITGNRIKDTQTGLRGLPNFSINWMLNVPLNGYDYEMEILLECLAKRIPYIEVAIETIYFNRNSSSHFNPALDSIRIYKVILRHVLRSMQSRLLFKTNKTRNDHHVRYDHKE